MKLKNIIPENPKDLGSLITGTLRGLAVELDYQVALNELLREQLDRQEEILKILAGKIEKDDIGRIWFGCIYSSDAEYEIINDFFELGEEDNEKEN